MPRFCLFLRQFCPIFKLILGDFCMKKELIHDPIFLNSPSEKCTKEDLESVQDLEDTLAFHKANCVGMAGNMIGVKKRFIVFFDHGKMMTMLNPEIVKQSGEYKTKEGCLSLLGAPRDATRYKTIKVKYETKDFQPRFKTYEGFTAQIIQHEIDHLNGILI